MQKPTYFLRLLSLFFVYFATLLFSEKANSQSSVAFWHIGVPEGLSQNSVYSIFRDSKGFLWLSTEDGLNRFDGYEFKVYRYEARKAHSISDDFTRSITEDAEGNLWIATDGGGLCQFNPRSEEFSPIFHQANSDNTLPSDKVLKVLYRNDKTLWLSSDKGGFSIYHISEKRFTHYNSAKSIDGSEITFSYVNAILPDSAGAWLGTEKGLCRFESQTKEIQYFPALGIPEYENGSMPITSLFIDHYGRFWVGSMNGLFKFNRSKMEFSTALFEASKRHFITDLNEDMNGRIWVGTYEGLCILNNDSGNFEWYTKGDDSGLTSNHILCVFRDNLGAMWVGTRNGGANIFDPKLTKFSTLKSHNSYLDPDASNAKCILNYKGKLYVGTFGSGICEVKNNHLTPITQFEGKNLNLPDKRVRSLLMSTDGKLWVGTIGGLLVLDVKTGASTVYKHNPDQASSISDNDIWALSQDGFGTVWVGTRNGGINIYDHLSKSFKRILANFNDSLSLSSNRIKGIIQDKQGNVWVATSGGGVSKFDPITGKFTNFKNKRGNPNSLSNNYTNCVFEDKKGRIWVGTYSGLNLLGKDPLSCSYYTEQDGLANDVVYAIAEDSKGLIWMSTNKGLSSFDPEKKLFHNFDSREGIQDAEFNPCANYTSPTGRLYFGGNNGLTHFHPDSIPVNPNPPKVVFTKLEVFGKEIMPVEGQSILNQYLAYEDEIVLTHHENMFTIYFSALNFTLSEKNKYSYKLEGFDEDWIEIGNRRFVTYTNLPGGTYTFLVKASNNDGVWSSLPTSLNIVIVPPFWKTWWFFLLLCGGAGFIVWGVYKTRVRLIEAQKARLEDLVEQRTAEINAQKNLLEETNNTLHGTMQQLKTTTDRLSSSIRYARHIQHIILPTPEDLNSFFKDHFVIYMPKDVVSGDMYWFSRISNNAALLIVADCTGHGVSGAFMTMVANTLLHEIVVSKKTSDPAEILFLLNEGIRRALKQKESDNEDGLDVAIALFEKNKDQTLLTFAGARSTMMIFHQGECTILKGQKIMLGGATEKKIEYQKQQMVVDPSHVMYFFSDGYYDQNNRERKRIGSTTFKQKLSEIYKRPLTEQKEALLKLLSEFSEGEPQRDDITVLGVRLK